MTQAATLAQLASSGAISADTSGNVGIGTTTPSYKLHVSGTSVGGFVTSYVTNTDTTSGSAAASYVVNGTVTGVTYASQSVGGLVSGTVGSVPYIFITNNTEAMRIDGSGNVSGVIKSKTAVASTSGTSIDFTGIPSTAKRITVMFDGVSTNGASSMQIQLGTSSGVQTTGYNCIYSYNGPSNSGGAVTTGFPIFHNTAADTKQGHAIFVLLNNNVWVGNGNFGNLGGQPGYSMLTAGSKSLGATLDRVRITTVNGTDTFDAGTINILYE